MPALSKKPPSSSIRSTERTPTYAHAAAPTDPAPNTTMASLSREIMQPSQSVLCTGAAEGTDYKGCCNSSGLVMQNAALATDFTAQRRHSTLRDYSGHIRAYF